MRVTYDLPPEIVSAVEGQAAAHDMTKDEFVAERLREQTILATPRQRVDSLVRRGMCDADVAEVMRYSPGRIAAIRRSLGLKANRRYKKD